MSIDGVADVLGVVGDRWALLVVREVGLGLRRFDEIATATGMPRAVLSDRVRRLTAAGILATRPYRLPGSRPRQEYLLTDAGTDLLPVIAALSDWSARHPAAGSGPFSGSGERDGIVYRHGGCGGRVGVHLRCECGEELTPGGRVLAEVTR